MCGIAGTLLNPANEDVKLMIEKLAHRGPDGNGVQNLEAATLGHTRLAILDIEGGHQPMQFEDTWIAFNGEIYNYRDLQSKYLPGMNLKTHSDTEVILRLFRQFGPEFVEMLDGMFAFAIYHNGEFLLARDPLGIKPLYFGMGRDNQHLCFASEIKALAEHVTSVQEFPAGFWFHSKLGWNRFYQIEETIQPFEGDEKQALPLIKSTLREAVHKRLLADVPVGVSLSGGLDSSIVSLLACEGADQLHSFAVGVEGSGKGVVYVDDIRLYRSAPKLEEIFLEAEAGTITAPMKTYDDPLASGGKYIGTDNGIGDQNNNPPATGVATYNFAVQGGTYKIAMRIKPDQGNSVWVRIAGATKYAPGTHTSGWIRFNDMAAGAEWHWDEVHSSDHNNQVVSITLPAGQHSLQIAYREDGCQIDAILITASAN